MECREVLSFTCKDHVYQLGIPALSNGFLLERRSKSSPVRQSSSHPRKHE